MTVTNPILFMVITGLGFGIWPLIMPRSGLPGFEASVVFAVGVALMLMVIFLIRGVQTDLATVGWGYVVVAVAFGAIALWSFNTGLLMAEPSAYGRLIIIMLVVQAAVPALYHCVVNETLELRTGVGVIAALVAVVALTK